MHKSLFVIFSFLVVVVSTQRTDNRTEIECFKKNVNSSLGTCKGLYCYKIYPAGSPNDVKLGCYADLDKLSIKPGTCTEREERGISQKTVQCICDQPRCNASSALSITLPMLSLCFLVHRWFYSF